MNILHISTSDLDGGAARAAYRLHQGLLEQKLASKMLVRAKLSHDETVISYKPLLARVGSKLDGTSLCFYPKRDKAMFSPQIFPDSIVNKVQEINPDIIHLHWACNGYLKIESLAKFKCPIVWTLHDMWAFTGGCHYTQDCERYTEGCGMCPQLGSTQLNDLSRKTWLRKSKAWSDLNLTVITPSRWMAQCAESSPLFKQFDIKVIPNGIDTQKYKPFNAQLARDALNLPKDKLLVLFGAGSGSDDPRKGFQYLLSALQKLNLDRWGDRLELVIFGDSGTANSLSIDLKTHYLGRLNDDVSLALAYSSADLFVAPSVQDNLPNTVVEALACGIPCLAFNIGGMSDMIDHHQNGYLAHAFSTKDLLKGIEWILEDPSKLVELKKNARKKVVSTFCTRQQVKATLRVYQTA